MADFSHIQSLQTVVGEGGKVLLQLRVAGSQELLQVQWVPKNVTVRFLKS